MFGGASMLSPMAM